MERRKIIPKPLRAAAFALAWGIALTACIRDDADNRRAEGQYVTVEMTVPGFSIPKTRSIEDGKGEAVVETVDVMVFDKSTHPQLIEIYSGSNIWQETVGTDYKVSFSVPLPQIANAGTVAVVANAAAAVAAAKTNAAGTAKSDVLAALQFATVSATGRYEWKVAEDDYTPIPMYGEAAVDGIASGATISGIGLTRMVARVDIENRVSGETFDLEEIYLVNYHAAGYIAPHWNRQNGKVWAAGEDGYIYDKNTDPTLPAGAPKPGNSQAAAMKYTYDQPADAPGPLMAGEIYAYEEVKNDPSGRICLILKGNYMGTECFYRVDFTSGKAIAGQDVAVGDPIPIYRNHKYTFIITAAEGIGYGSFDEALQSSTVLSNLKTTLLVVDMAGVNEIVYDGQYFMGVESREVWMPFAVSRQFNVRVGSDYHGGWTAEVADPAATPWLRLNQSSGTNINATGLDITVEAIGAPATGQVIFTAGRLQDVLTVRRVSMADMFARSNIVMQSGMLTFAVTAADNAAIPASSQGVFFKWGSLVALAPAGNPYDPLTQAVYYPPGLNPIQWTGGMAGWDRIPYAHPNFGFNVAPSGDNSDAFAAYNNGTGYNTTVGIGDICRYVSSGPGGKGWVAGRWRMPTYTEMEMLYDETEGNEVGAGTFANITGTAVVSDPLGMSKPGSGWFEGLSVTAGIGNDPDNRDTPPAGTVFLPASGHRYPDGDGIVVHAGAYGYYWSATPYTIYTVNYGFLAQFGISFNDADRSYAFPIRCIRDY